MIGLEKLNYKDYPEYMFAMIAAYLPKREGDDLRRVAGGVVFKHTDDSGNTYKNGLLHSYNDLPAVIVDDSNQWYRDGLLHREGDLPAVIEADICEWYKNGVLHREGDNAAVIAVDDDGDDYKLWYKNGVLHRDGDNPAAINGDSRQWWKNGKKIKIT
jgi:hypothetical protein